MMTVRADYQVSWDTVDLSGFTSCHENIFTVDVEEWFQVGAFEHTLERADWDNLESRVVLQTRKILSLLEKLSVKGTFFCLGWVAERHPDLIAEIALQGHEIACHGSSHQRLHTMTRKEVEEDIIRSKQALESAINAPVYGYRAPSFSLTQEVWWVYEILQEHGFSYSSSLYPVTTDHYGMKNAPRKPFYPIGKGKLVEVPMTVCDTVLKRFPASGGGYFRLMPYVLSRYLFRKGIEQTEAPAIYYMHPWEMDPEQPYVHQASLLSKFRHYTGQKKLAAKLEKLTEDFSWTRLIDVYGPVVSKEGNS